MKGLFLQLYIMSKNHEGRASTFAVQLKGLVALLDDFTVSVVVLLLQTVSSLLPENDKYLGLNIHGIKN